MIKIIHTVTSDSPDGQPWPPTERSDVLWRLVRRADDCSYWRAIEPGLDRAERSVGLFPAQGAPAGSLGGER